MHPVLNLILTHQSRQAVSRMLDYWGDYAAPENILLGYGGPGSEFEAIAHPQKFLVDDPRLRTRDHQREFQSYTRLFRGAADFMRQAGSEAEFIHFAEYDHLPLVPDLNARQLDRLKTEHADVLAFHLHRVDGTSNPHFLYHTSDPRFGAHWQEISRRKDKNVVLSMFGSGSFWSRGAFFAVAAQAEPFPMYLELYLPTLAHHLGFRVRDFAEQDRFGQVLQDATGQIQPARAEGAWTLHPVKRLWTE